MQELEKILEEIELEKKRLVFYPDCSSAFSAVQIRTIEKIEQIICKYMSIRKHINDGWVSVEERLPEESGYYLVQLSEKLPNEDYSDRVVVLYSEEDKDFMCYSSLIIAWRSLPEPYRPEKE